MPPNVIDQMARILEIDPAQLFQRDGSPENLCRYGREQYVQEVTDQIMSRLQDVVAREVRRSLDS